MCALSVDLVGVAESQGADPAPLLEDARGLARFVADGLARWDGRRIDVTEKGRPFVRSIAALFDSTMRGAPVEVEHLLGDLVARAERHGIDTPLLSTARTCLAVYQAQLAARAT